MIIIRRRYYTLAFFTVLVATMTGCATPNTDFRNSTGQEIKPGAVVTLVIVNNRKIKERSRLEQAIFSCIGESIHRRDLDIQLLNPAQLPRVPDYQKGWNAYVTNEAWNKALHDYNVDTLMVISERSVGSVRRAWQELSATMFAVRPELKPAGTIHSTTTDNSGTAGLMFGVLYYYDGVLIFPVPIAIPPSSYERRNCKEFGDATASYIEEAMKGGSPPSPEQETQKD